MDDRVESIEELCTHHDVSNAIAKRALESRFRTQLEQTAAQAPRTIGVDGFAVELCKNGARLTLSMHLRLGCGYENGVPLQ